MRSLDADKSIVIIEDEANLLQSYKMLFEECGLGPVLCFQDPHEGLRYLIERDCRLLILDLWMPGLSGEEILAQLHPERAEIPVVVVTAAGNVETAIACMKMGAVDFLVKPVDENRLLATVRNALGTGDLRRENARLKESLLSGVLRRPECFLDLHTEDERMFQMFRYLEAIAVSDEPVLITGETGVGKGLIAEAIHRSSSRSGRFVSLNVGGVDEAVFSDTLFGHEKGAFTGADRHRSGLIREADQGTLFLDEIGELSGSLQVKLLRLLQEREFFSLGSDHAEKSKARVVFATNKDLMAEVRAGRFRRDLYYRLNAHSVFVPPLRERPCDLRLLANLFLVEASRAIQIPTMAAPEWMIGILRHYPFPGNVRELRSVVHEFVGKSSLEPPTEDLLGRILGARSSESHRIDPSVDIGAEGIGSGGHMPPGVAGHGSSPRSFGLESRVCPLLAEGRLPALSEMEQWLIDEAIRRAGGNISAAAEMLGTTRQTLYRKSRG